MAEIKDTNGYGDGAAQKVSKAPATKKTTFDKETVFVCLQDCWQNMNRYRRGDTLTGRICPPHFAVQSAEEEKK